VFRTKRAGSGKPTRLFEGRSECAVALAQLKLLYRNYETFKANRELAIGVEVAAQLLSRKAVPGGNRAAIGLNPREPFGAFAEPPRATKRAGSLDPVL
jgi:hypothetical protein